MTGALKHPLLQWLIYGHVWLAFAVASQIAWTGFFLQEAPVPRYAIAAALGLFAGYGVMRLARSRSPERDLFPNLIWYHRNRTAITVLVGASALAAFILMWPFWPIAWRWLLPVMVLAFFYVTPFTSSSGRSIGLRSIPLLKAFLIAVLWSLVTVAVPMRLDSAHHGTFTIAANACMRLPLFLGLVIAFDIRDHGADEPSLRTLPMVFGIRGAKMISVVLLAFSALFSWVFLHRLEYPLSASAVLLGYAYAVVLVLRAKPVRDPIYFALLVDGAMILIPLLVWIGMR